MPLDFDDSHYRKLVEASRELILSLDPSRVVTMVSPSWGRILGRPEGDVVGRPFLQVLHPDDRPLVDEKLVLSATFIEGEELYCRIRRNDGSWRTFSLSISPCCVGDPLVAWVLTARDMTDHRRMDDIMLLAEKMNMLGGLVAGMAHELNNPIGAVVQNAQNIERRLSPELSANRRVADEIGIDLEKVSRYLEERGILQFLTHIRNAGAQAGRIISNLMQFVRRGEGVITLHPLSGIVDQAVELVRTDYDLKKKYDVRGVEFAVSHADPTLRVRVNPADIQQVLFNILSNAVQALFGVGGERRVTITTGTEGPMVSISIADNGPGMDEVTRRHIFDPFFSTKPPGSGTGLGLTVAYAIIARGYDGRMEVESRGGEGTTFRILLPKGES